MDEFLFKVAEILEVAHAMPDMDFRTVEDWNSLKGFSLLVLLENDYGKVLPVADFLRCRTVGDLAAFAGLCGV